MRTSKSTTIGNYEYTVTCLGGSETRKVFIRLAKLLGAGAGAKNTQAAVAGVLTALNDEDAEFLCTAFAKTTTVKYGERQSPQLSGIFEEHFAGNMMDQLKWLVFCVEVNYGNFLDEFGLSSNAMTQALNKVKQSNFQTELTGLSGDSSGKDGQLSEK